MSSPPHPPAAARLARVSDGARALLDQLEHETRVLERLRRQADAAELVRLRLEQALDALMPALPEAEAQAARQRMRAARRGEHTAASRAHAAPTAEILTLLAGWTKPAILVGEVQHHLVLRGYALRRTYAAGALTSLAAQGVAHKTGRGRYRINRSHPELMALRLAALEAELQGLE